MNLDLKSIINSAIDVDAITAAVEQAVAEELKGMSIGDLAALAEGGAPAPRAKPGRKPAAKSASKGGRLARRSPEEIAKAVGNVAAVLRKASDGMRAEQIRESTGLSSKELPKVLKAGVASGAFRVLHGEKRATTYGVGKASASRKASKKTSAKKTSAKPKAKASKKASSKKSSAKPRKASKKAAPVTNGVAHAEATA